MLVDVWTCIKPADPDKYSQVWFCRDGNTLTLARDVFGQQGLYEGPVTLELGQLAEINGLIARQEKDKGS